jgi:hypothetical protein
MGREIRTDPAQSTGLRSKKNCGHGGDFFLDFYPYRTNRALTNGTILAMFDLIDPKPRGFSGRPLIALLFAAGLGTAAYPLGSRFHLNDFTVFVILSTVTFVVGYAWEHLDARCG